MRVRNPKVSEELERDLAGRAPTDQVEVVVEIVPHNTRSEGLTRFEQVEIRKKEFDRAVSSVAARIREAGGTVLGTVWLNLTLHGCMPVSSIDEVASDVEVRRLDSVRRVTREG